MLSHKEMEVVQIKVIVRLILAITTKLVKNAVKYHQRMMKPVRILLNISVMEPLTHFSTFALKRSTLEQSLWRIHVHYRGEHS